MIVDTKILIKDAKARFKHNEAKIQLEEKYNNQLIIPYNGGMWQITPQLLTILQLSPPTTILLDIYNNPIEINTKELKTIAQNIYDTIMYKWHEEYNQLMTLR